MPPTVPQDVSRPQPQPVEPLQNQPSQPPEPIAPAEGVVDTPQKPKHRTLWLIIIVSVIVLAGASLSIYALLQPPKIDSSIRTYFSYNQSDIDALKALSSTDTITTESVGEWDDKTYEIIESNGTIDVDASKVYAYLTVAQMDAAALSYQAHGSFMGSVEAVSKEVLCEVYPDDCSGLIINEDPYSKLLSEIVMEKITARISEDVAQNRPVVLRDGDDLWQGPLPQDGILAPSFKPWFMTTGDQFRAEPPVDPDSDEKQAELALVKETLANATNEQKALVVKWAGGPGTRTPPGIWFTLANDYMQAENTPLDTFLETRAMVAASMADAVIGAFDSKYFHQYKRPFLFDDTIVTIMPTPNHPSYPAAHATISWAAATVLSAYLPENKAEWESEAREATDSRIIGGIHFPADNEAGTTMGKNIGNQVLTVWKK